MMDRANPIPAELLRELLDYDPESGVLVWRWRAENWFTPSKWRTASHNCALWNARHAGKPALTSISANGYCEGTLLGKAAKAHRVAFALMTGRWPPEDIDHINGAKTDNRWANLRAVTRTENGRNQKRHSTNTSGVPGVTWDASTSRWRAQIIVSGKPLRLGRFERLEDAAAARANAEREHGFHKNHGRVA